MMLRPRTPSNKWWRNVQEWLILMAIIFPFAYLFAASAVFQLRHPWMTDTERMLYLYRALTWQSVDYDEARRRH